MKNTMAILILLLAFSLRSEEYNFLKQYGGACSGASTYGHYSYFNSGGNILVLDTSNPDSPVEVAKFHLGSAYCDEIEVKDNLIFFATGKGVKIYSLNNPLQPEFISVINRSVQKIMFKESLLILGTSSYSPEGAFIYDIANPANPIYKSYAVFTFNDTRAYALRDSMIYGYYQEGYSGSQFIYGYNISNPANPVLTVQKKIMENSCTYAFIGDMQIKDNHLLAEIQDSIKIFDLDNAGQVAYRSAFKIRPALSGFTITGNKMLLMHDKYGIVNLDITNLASPVETGNFLWNAQFDNFCLSDQRLYLCGSVKGLKVVDIGSSNNFAEKYNYTKSTEVFQIQTDGDYGYVSTYYKGFQIWDLTDDHDYTVLGSLDLARARQMERFGDYIFYLSESDSTLKIINVANKNNPYICQQIESQLISDYCINNNRLFILARNGILVYNISNPANPVFVININRQGRSIKVEGNRMFIHSTSDYPFVNTLDMYNITNISNISLKSQLVLDGIEYSGRLLMKYPYFYIGGSQGLAICKVNTANKLQFCDQMMWLDNSFCTFYNYHLSDNLVYAERYAMGVYIFDVRTPTDIKLAKILDESATSIYRDGHRLAITKGFGGTVFYAISDSTSVADAEVVPQNATLFNNYPNPFNPNTTISYNLMFPAEVKIAIYDITGKEIAILETGKKAAGTHQTEFKAENLSSGVYFCRLQVDGKNIGINKMILLK